MKKSVKKISVLLLSALFVLSAIPFFTVCGRLTGAENERAEIYKGRYCGEYVISSCDHSVRDRKRIIGQVRGNGNYFAFSSSCEKGCIYIASSGRGEFYEPQMRRHNRINRLAPDTTE